jgi:hypothetical protein
MIPQLEGFKVSEFQGFKDKNEACISFGANFETLKPAKL